MGGRHNTIGGDQRARALFRPAIAGYVDLPNGVPGWIVIDNANTVVVTDDARALVSTLGIQEAKQEETIEQGDC